MLWSTTPKGRLSWSNAESARLLGATAGQPIETTITRKLHEQDRRRWCDCWHSALTSGTAYHVEYRIQAEDGPDHWYLEHGTPVHARGAGPIACWLMVATCIDHQKQREAELRNMVERRDDFFATLLHELRNPLAPIANGLALLGACGSSTTGVNSARHMIERQLRQLTRLVDDLLDVSRIAHGSIELQRSAVDLADVVAVAVDAARPILKVRQHQLILESPARPVFLEGDPVRLAQVLTNILINAAKYTNPHGHIWLATTEQDGFAAIRVRDDGIGIAPDKLADIFQLFARAVPEGQGSRAGLGVGLSISRQLVELHGGSLSVRSDGIGHGSEFTVRLPVGWRHT
jgi:signal transduction histidine kinase